MVVFIFFLFNKNDKVQFLKKKLLLVNVSLDIIFEIFFLTMSNANINF